MFSNDIVGSDAFIDMPSDSQLLYFHLGMRADDDGFVPPRNIMRMIGASEDSLKILIGKKFVIPFESGVVVIRHWKAHNTVRADRYQPSNYREEKRMLSLDSNTYFVVQDGNQVATIAQPSGRLSKEVSKKESKGDFSKEKGRKENANAGNPSMKSIGEFVRGGFKNKKASL